MDPTAPKDNQNQGSAQPAPVPNQHTNPFQSEPPSGAGLSTSFPQEPSAPLHSPDISSPSDPPAQPAPAIGPDLSFGQTISPQAPPSPLNTPPPKTEPNDPIEPGQYVTSGGTAIPDSVPSPAPVAAPPPAPAPASVPPPPVPDVPPHSSSPAPVGNPPPPPVDPPSNATIAELSEKSPAPAPSFNFQSQAPELPKIDQPDPTPYVHPQDQPQALPHQEESKIGKLKIVTIGLGVLVLLAIIGGVAWFFLLGNKSQPPAAVTDQGALPEELPPLPKRTDGGFANLPAATSEATPAAVTQ